MASFVGTDARIPEDARERVTRLARRVQKEQAAFTARLAARTGEG